MAVHSGKKPLSRRARRQRRKRIAAMRRIGWIVLAVAAVFTAALFEGFGFDVTPRYDEPRADIIQAVQLREREALCAFIRGIQQGAPVDSFVVPEPSPMPGYDCDVIMASGSFTFGSSIELSADAPLREPFAAWMQGGVNFNSGRLGAILAAQSMLNAGFLNL